jgi:hypothetical protein
LEKGRPDAHTIGSRRCPADCVNQTMGPPNVGIRGMTDRTATAREPLAAHTAHAMACRVPPDGTS